MNLFDKEKDEIGKEILKQVSIGQLINYEDFKKLYEPYKLRITEVEFASILGISYSNYRNILNRKSRTRILKGKDPQISNEEIRQEVLKQISIGQLINYEDFKKLYEPYKLRITEVGFASILGISYGNYRNIRYKMTKARVLKRAFLKISDEEKEKIEREILKQVSIGQLINYEDFKKLYEPYKSRITEVEFASILGISYTNYMNVRSKGKRAKIFKNSFLKINDEEKEEIRQEVLKQVNIGQLINYEDLKKIYEPYNSRITEVEFASILGISYTNYMAIRNKMTKAVIKDYIMQAKIKRIKYIINESRYYSITELEELAKRNEMDIDTLLQCIFNFQDIKNVGTLSKSLKSQGQLWIGFTPCSKNFSEKYASYMIEITTKISKILTARYRCRDIKDDIVSDCIIYIIENRGDIEKNHLNDYQIKKSISYIILKYIKFACQIYKERNKPSSLFKIYGDGKEINILDKEEITSINAEVDVVEATPQEDIDSDSESLEEACLKLLKKYIEVGYSGKQAILEVSRFVGINIDDMLKMLRKYMIEEQQVKLTSTGNYILKR